VCLGSLVASGGVARSGRPRGHARTGRAVARARESSIAEGFRGAGEAPGPPLRLPVPRPVDAAAHAPRRPHRPRPLLPRPRSPRLRPRRCSPRENLCGQIFQNGISNRSHNFRQTSIALARFCIFSGQAEFCLYLLRQLRPPICWSRVYTDDPLRNIFTFITLSPYQPALHIDQAHRRAIVF